MKQLLKLTFLTIATVLLLCGTVNAQLNKYYFFNRARILIGSEDYSQAIQSLNTLIKVDSTIAEAWFLRGVAKYNLNDIIGAQQDFSKSIKFNPVYSQAYLYRGITLSNLSKHQQALSDFEATIDLRPNSPDGYYSRGITYLLLNRIEKSIDDFNKVIQLQPKNIDAWLNRGSAKLYKGDSLIGQFTEKWSKTLFEPIAKELGLYAVNSVVCDELGLSRQSSADLAFCTTNNTVQKPENIKLLFEIKMSVVSNYKYTHPNNVEYIGDYKQHKGNPALLRSDSMLKAIGKSINIRVSGIASTKIPVVVLGNSPITDSYVKKVDFLKTSGVIQGFWSLNPKPTNSDYVKNTPKLGFQTILDKDQLFNNCKELVTNDMNYFSSMISKLKLGEIIRIASQEATDIAKAEKFLTLIRS